MHALSPSPFQSSVGLKELTKFREGLPKPSSVCRHSQYWLLAACLPVSQSQRASDGGREEEGERGE